MRHASSATSNRRRWAARAGFALLGIATLLGPGPAAGAQPPAAANPAVITTWNEVAVRAIAGPTPHGAGKANAEGFLWFSFVQAAVYNAVNGITGEYDLYRWNARAPKGASPQAAAAAAAHRVLMTYFGANATTAADLDAAYATSLAQIPDGVSKAQGIRYGERAAQRLIRMRANDGRNAPIVFNVPQPTPAGVWRPTPPAGAPFLAPWLSQVDPLMLDSLSQFRPGPPPAIGSDLYRREFEEVRDSGVKLGSSRTAAQTQSALFFFDIAVGPLQAALRDQVTRHGLNISDSARLFAAVDLSLADSVDAVWDAKFHYGWWRPITAIREADNDGDPNTAGVPLWEPFLPTPPYPEWPSGLNSVVAAASTVLSRLNPGGHVDLYITSAGAGETRHYDNATAMQQEAVNARIWSGIHFRTSDEVGRTIGIEVANWALDHYFAPTK